MLLPLPSLLLPALLLLLLWLQALLTGVELQPLVPP
jgi:hypothetical protein